ncbi:unnamed protein product [Boreogadus saida]
MAPFHELHVSASLTVSSMIPPGATRGPLWGHQGPSLRQPGAHWAHSATPMGPLNGRCQPPLRSQPTAVP